VDLVGYDLISTDTTAMGMYTIRVTLNSQIAGLLFDKMRVIYSPAETKLQCLIRARHGLAISANMMH
jgi:hypothetical protein